LFFFVKQKTAYEITYGDWSSDVCSSDLMIFNNLNEIGVKGDDITQFIDQNIIERFCVYMVVEVYNPVSKLGYFDVGLGLTFWEVTTII